MSYNMSSRLPLVGFVLLIIVCVLVALPGLVAAQKDPGRPEQTVPEQTVPEQTVPELTVPELTMPLVTVPLVTVPLVPVPLVPVPSGDTTDTQDGDSSRPATMQLNPTACGDPGPSYIATDETTLNGAIDCVNSAVAGTGTYTITIDATINLITDTTAIETSVADEIIINGNNNTVDGGGNGRVFEVKGGSIVSFQAITITGGLATGKPGLQHGGGILVRGNFEGATVRDTEVTITNSTLSGNEALDGGGGLHVDRASHVQVENSTIYSNTAPYGGGIWTNDAGTVVTVTNSIVSDNVSASLGGLGGGILVSDASTVLVDESTISGNRAVYGGGILVQNIDTTVTITNSTIVTITNSTISNNLAADYAMTATVGLGGGVLASNGGTIVLGNSTVSDNVAIRVGGGIYVETEGTVSVDESTISGNKATFGGGIVVKHPDTEVTITNSTISNNLAASMTITNSTTISNNLAASMTITNSTISNNEAASSSPPAFGVGGGVIASDGGTIVLENSIVSDNVVVTTLPGAGTGGGIYVGKASTVSIDTSTIKGNSAPHCGGILVQGAGTEVTITDSTISGNSAFDDGGMGGGVVVTHDSKITLENSTVISNTVANGSGGGIWVQDADTELAITYSTISGNSAYSGGGGIHHDDYTGGTVTVTNTIVALQASGDDCSGSIASGGYNIESGTSCGFTGTGDQIDVSSGDLALQPFLYNGGPMWIMALGSGSVAIDQIPPDPQEDDCSLPTDQRGVLRPQGSLCDVGAFELEVTADPPVSPLVSGTPVSPTLSLSWQHEMENTRYEVWRSTTPYFTPGLGGGGVVIADWQPSGGSCSLSNVDIITCTDDTGVLSNPGDMYIYIVRAYNSSGASPDSNRLGVITFGLQPGG